MCFSRYKIVVVNNTANGFTIFLFFSPLQGHFKEFAKKLIILQKMEIMSRMLQNTYYVRNKCLSFFQSMIADF